MVRAEEMKRVSGRSVESEKERMSGPMMLGQCAKDVGNDGQSEGRAKECLQK